LGRKKIDRLGKEEDRLEEEDRQSIGKSIVYKI
jgi:hypothetical protein